MASFAGDFHTDIWLMIRQIGLSPPGQGCCLGLLRDGLFGPSPGVGDPLWPHSPQARPGVDTQLVTLPSSAGHHVLSPPSRNISTAVFQRRPRDQYAGPTLITNALVFISHMAPPVGSQNALWWPWFDLGLGPGASFYFFARLCHFSTPRFSKIYSAAVIWTGMLTQISGV